MDNKNSELVIQDIYLWVYRTCRQWVYWICEQWDKKKHCTV